MSAPSDSTSGALRRVIGLPALTLYGVGTMVGGGFYALLGEVAGEAGVLAPAAFLAAGVLALLNALCFAELSSRFPVSAGEARYVLEGTGRRGLSTLTGWMVIATGVVSAATLSVATAGFLRDLVELPELPVRVGVVALLTATAAWGVGHSVLAVVVITVLEVGTIVYVVVRHAGRLGELPEVWRAAPAVEPWAAAAAVFSAAFLAFYAFIGFEDVVNMAEEVKRPRRNLPRALILGVLLTTLLYLLGSSVAVIVARPEELAASRTPVALLVGARGETGALLVTLVSLLAGVNGALVQIVMASRVAFGLARQGGAPDALGRVAERTGTPLRATVAAGAVVLALSLGAPLAALAATTSGIILAVFALVNVALWRLQGEEAHAGDGAPGGDGGAPGLRTPRWVPAAAAAACVAALVAKLALALG